MHFTSETTADGVSEHLFNLGDIPGVLWTPTGAPGHGDRPRTSRDDQHAARIRRRMAAGEPIGSQIARDNTERSARAVPEWRARFELGSSERFFRRHLVAG